MRLALWTENVPSAVCILSSLPIDCLITPYGPAPFTTSFNHYLSACWIDVPFPQVSFAQVLVSLDRPSCRSVTTVSGELGALTEVQPVVVGSSSENSHFQLILIPPFSFAEAEVSMAEL